MNKLKSLFQSKTSTVVVVALVAGLSVLGFIAPRALNSSKAEGCAVYDSPVFNPFPVTWENNPGAGCQDFAVLSGGVSGSGYWTNNVNAQVGDTVTLRVYVHNGAALNSGAVMQGAQYSVNMSQGAGSSHYVSATLSASNAASKTGGITINTPAGASLEVVSGNLQEYLGSIEPCFDYSKSYYISVRVVGGQTEEPKSASLNASLGSKIGDQCLYNGTVSWNTSGYNNVEVKVVSPDNGQEVVMAANESGTEYPNWITPGQNYVFNLYGDGQLLDTKNINASGLSCNEVVNPGTPASGNIDFNISHNRVGTLCQLYGNVNWNTQNVDNVRVYVINNGSEQLFGAAEEYNATVDWFTPGEQYEFILRGDGGFVKSTGVKTAPDLNCGSVAGAQPTGAIDFTISNNRVGNLCQLYGTITWSTENVNNVNVYVRNNGVEKLFGSYDTLSQTVDWFTPSEQYQFILRGDGGFVRQTAVKTAPALNCGVAPTPTPYPTYVYPTPTPFPTPPVYPTPTPIQTFTATATASANANASASCPAGASATASASASATATASSNVSQADAQNKAHNQAYSQAQANAQANASASASANCPNAPQNYNANATADANGSASYTCPSGVVVSATASASASASANSTVSLSDAQSKAYGQAMDSAQAQANASARVSAQAKCPTVVVTPTPFPTVPVYPTPTPGCNNNWNSCNNNTNTNNSTNNNSTNSSNQNNNSNINGNNNVVTQTNQNCVNNSCNTVYMSTGGDVIPANLYRQLSITKMVSAQGTGFQNSVSVQNGQTVQFQIVVTNTGNATANNVRLTDNLPSGLTYVNGSMSGGYAYGYNNLSNMNLGNLSAGQSVTVTFSATVNIGNGTVQNIASASSDNAGQVQASAWVFVTGGNVQGGSVNLSYSKKAYNDTKGSDATSVVASRENYITYTLTVQNTGNTPANSFVITDDLSQVLPYADITDNGGGSVSGNVITFPGITVPAGGSVSRSFKVRIKYSLADNLSYTMSNTYGNTVTVRINTPQVLGAFVAPKTGADTMGIMFSTILTASAVVFKKRKDLLKLIFT